MCVYVKKERIVWAGFFFTVLHGKYNNIQAQMKTSFLLQLTIENGKTFNLLLCCQNMWSITRSTSDVILVSTKCV